MSRREGGRGCAGGGGEGGQGGGVLEARLKETYMDQDHGACCEADAVHKEPVKAKVSNIGANVRKLPHRLSNGKDQGC